MSQSSVNCCVRTLTAAAAAFVLVGSAAYSEKINPFTKFGGNWTGSGLIYLSNGTKEKIRCRAAIHARGFDESRQPQIGTALRGR